MKIESKYLMETEWLADHLNDPDLVLIECSALMPNYYEESAAESIEVISGRDEYLAGHLPGADFVDLVNELSDRTDTTQNFPLPSKEQFIEVMNRHGIGTGAKVVIYDRTLGLWSCRLWLMIRSYGFDDVAVLNGGWNKWLAEGRAINTQEPVITERTFTPKKSQNMFATKDDAIKAMKSNDVCLINALDPEEFAGHGTMRYARAGHIPSSINVPFMFLVKPETGEFFDREVVEEMFRKAGAFDKERVVSYCGGAIGACSGVFLMSVMGIEDVTLYNGSLKEWADDPDLPLLISDEVEQWHMPIKELINAVQ